MQKRDDPGKFRQLDEIMFVNSYPGYQHLIPIAENCMQVVCEIKGNPIHLSFNGNSTCKHAKSCQLGCIMSYQMPFF